MKRRRFWLNLLVFGLLATLFALGFAIVKLAYDGALGYVHPSRSHRTLDDNPAKLGIEYQNVILTTKDGIELTAWYTPAANGAAILVAHGYGDKRSSQIHTLFARYGYGVVSWDFRAHGESGGELCTMSYSESLDVEAALDFALMQPNIRQVGAWGASMGAATIINAAASRQEISAVVADSAFSTLKEELDIMVSVGILRPLVRFFAEREAGLEIDQVRPVDLISLISPRPVFLIQGEEDVVVPADAAQKLYEAAGEPRTLWMVPRAGHIGSVSAKPEEYERRVIAFFDESLSISH